MSEDRNIHCDKHGTTTPPCFVCVHLFQGEKVGYNPMTEPDPEWLDSREAFCDRCYKWWNRPWPFSMIYFMTVAKTKVVCTECMEEMRLRNDVRERKKAWWE